VVAGRRRRWDLRLSERLVPGAVGLSLAILLFPSTANELGTMAHQGTRASLRIIPAAVDTGMRCWADAHRVETAASGTCATRGFPALPMYLSDGAALVISEMRLSHTGSEIDWDLVAAGLERGQSLRRWGLKYAPYTAMAHGETRRDVLDSELDLSSLVLCLIVMLLGAAGWRSVWNAIDHEGPIGGLSDDERQAVISARRKNIALFIVLATGVYLSFAALTALGPFLEAKQLASQSSSSFSAESRIAQIDQTWATTTLHADTPEDDDLTRVQEKISSYTMLRQKEIRWSFTQVSRDYNNFERNYDASFNDIADIIQQLKARPRRSDAEAAQLAVANEARVAFVEAFKIANRAKDTPGDIDATKLYALYNQFRKVADGLDRLGRSVAVLEPAEQTRMLAHINRVKGATATFHTNFETAIEAYREAEYIAQSDYETLADALAEHREHRWGLRRELVSLQRRLTRDHNTARQKLREARSAYSKIQRSGPGWLDRAEALADWYEGRQVIATQELQRCTDELVQAVEDDRHEVARALDMYPSQSAESVTSLVTLRSQLDRFRDLLSQVGGEAGECTYTLPRKPAENSISGTYGTAIGILSGWLMASGTLDLVMIAGMLGFGLLGAGLSHIIRRQLHNADQGWQRSLAWLPNRPEQAPLVEDVPSVVFQGLGATLVVYLAGVGGLGAISSSTPSLDPYVLMLGCFVAAVFSEDVWRNAQEWVQKRSLPGA